MPEVIFPDKVLEIGERQLEILQGAGIVSRTRNGEGWQGTDSMKALQVMIESPGAFVCDFCSADNAVYEFPTEDFTMGTVKDAITTTHNSIGSWIACETCAKLVMGGDWQKLVQRVARKHMDKLDVPAKNKELAQAMTEEVLYGVYRKFQESWSGKQRRIGYE